MIMTKLTSMGAYTLTKPAEVKVHMVVKIHAVGLPCPHQTMDSTKSLPIPIIASQKRKCRHPNLSQVERKNPLGHPPIPVHQPLYNHLRYLRLAYPMKLPIFSC